MLVTTSIVNKRLSLALGWDTAAFPAGLVEEFWGHVVDGAREFMMEPAARPVFKL